MASRVIDRPAVPVINYPAFLPLLAGVLAIIPHYPIINAWFTGWDTLSLINSARLESLADIVTKPLMYGTGFTGDGLYFRPIISLSFWLQYRFFGLNPMGYHAISLAQHALASILIAAAGQRLHRWGGLAGLVFALHPMLAANVQAPERGQDVLATIFLLAAGLLMSDNRRWWGLAAYAAALGSKELAVVFVPVGIWLLWPRRQWIAGLLTITMGWWAWRAAVIGGVGGYRDATWSPVSLISTPIHYAAFLFWPWGIGQQIASSGQLLLSVGLTAVLILVLWQARSAIVARLSLLLVMPMGLYSMTIMQYWYFYLPAALGALLLTVAIINLAERRRWPGLTIMLAVVAALVISLWRPTGWAEAGRQNQVIINQVGKLAETMAPGETLYLCNAPGLAPAGTGVVMMMDHSIRSYFDLTGAYPDVQIEYLDMANTPAWPGELRPIRPNLACWQ